MQDERAPKRRAIFFENVFTRMTCQPRNLLNDLQLLLGNRLRKSGQTLELEVALPVGQSPF